MDSNFRADVEELIAKMREYAQSKLSSGAYTPTEYQRVSLVVEYHDPETNLASPQIGQRVEQARSWHQAISDLTKYGKLQASFQRLQGYAKEVTPDNFQSVRAADCLPGSLAFTLLEGGCTLDVINRFERSVLEPNLPRHCFMTIYGFQWSATPLTFPIIHGWAQIRNATPDDYLLLVDRCDGLTRICEVPPVFLRVTTSIPGDRGGLNQRAAFALLRTLALSKLGARHASHRLFTDALDYHNGANGQFSFTFPEDVAIVTDDQVPSLGEYCESVWPSAYQIVWNPGELAYIDKAFNEFENAQKSSPDRDSCVPKLVRALEILLVSERNQITRRVASRTALLAEAFGFECVQVENVMKQAYNVRSAFVHGDTLSEDDAGKWQSAVEKIGGLGSLLDIVRRIFLYSHLRCLPKQEFIEELELAICNPRERLNFARIVGKLDSERKAMLAV